MQDDGIKIKQGVRRELCGVALKENLLVINSFFRKERFRRKRPETHSAACSPDRVVNFMETKKVVLLGDSIRLMGYGSRIPALLGDGYEVWQPEDNGRFIQYILRQIFDYREQIEKAQIVHFNSGEWDICELFGDGPFTPPDMYVSQVMRVVKILQSWGKTVVFATTTPVREENPHNHNDVIRRFNELIVPQLQKAGVVVNDLYAVVAEDIYANVCDDNIHLSEQGIKRCAEQTAEVIRNVS